MYKVYIINIIILLYILHTFDLKECIYSFRNTK